MVQRNQVDGSNRNSFVGVPVIAAISAGQCEETNGLLIVFANRKRVSSVGIAGTFRIDFCTLLGRKSSTQSL